MTLKYRSGEEIRKGDRILYHTDPGTVALVAMDATDSEQRWYVEEFGGGVMLVVPKTFGHVFLRAGEIDEDEDLEYVERA